MPPRVQRWDVSGAAKRPLVFCSLAPPGAWVLSSGLKRHVLLFVCRLFYFCLSQAPGLHVGRLNNCSRAVKF